MALSVSLVWETRASGASDNNGGAYKAGAGTTDYSQQNAAQLTLTDLATTGAVTTVTSVTGGFTAAMVGNVIQIVSGTNFTAGFYEIITRVDTNTITVDRAPATGVGAAGTGSVGGALATLGKLSGAMVASNKGYCTGAFTTTATNTFAQALGAAPTGTAPASRLIGYGSTRGDNVKATLTLSVNTGLTGLLFTGLGWEVENFSVDCASLGTSTGIRVDGANSTMRNCKAANATTRGLFVSVTASGTIMSNCEATGCTSAATAAIANSAGAPYRCWAHDNACPGMVLAVNVTASFCLSANNSGASSDGISGGGANRILNCTVHGNGRHGIATTVATSYGNLWLNNILSNNGGYGLVGNTGTAIPAAPEYDGNAFYSNTSGTRNLMDSTAGIFGVNPYVNVADVILTASPYVGPVSGGSENFGLNLVAGGGAACRQVGIPGAIPGLATTVGYLDMGAVQARDTGGSHFIG